MYLEYNFIGIIKTFHNAATKQMCRQKFIDVAEVSKTGAGNFSYKRPGKSLYSFGFNIRFKTGSKTKIEKIASGWCSLYTLNQNGKKNSPSSPKSFSGQKKLRVDMDMDMD